MNAPFEIAEAQAKTTDEIIRYYELVDFVRSQGIEIPEDLHEKKREKPEQTPEERRDMKLFLLATAHVDYENIEVTEAEIQAKIVKHRAENKQAKAFVAFAEEYLDEEPAQKEETPAAKPVAKKSFAPGYDTPPRPRSEWCVCGKHVSECCCGEDHSPPHHPSGRAYDEEDYEQFYK